MPVKRGVAGSKRAFGGGQISVPTEVAMDVYWPGIMGTCQGFLSHSGLLPSEEKGQG